MPSREYPIANVALVTSLICALAFVPNARAGIVTNYDSLMSVWNSDEHQATDRMQAMHLFLQCGGVAHMVQSTTAYTDSTLAYADMLYTLAVDHESDKYQAWALLWAGQPYLLNSPEKARTYLIKALTLAYNVGDHEQHAGSRGSIQSGERICAEKDRIKQSWQRFLLLGDARKRTHE